MPIHLEDMDVMPHVQGLRSALIVPCTMCPAVSVAVREQRPFMNLFRSLLKSAPFQEHINALQSRLRERGVTTEVFRSNLYHQWFMCMWTKGRRRKLQRHVKHYDAVIALGCESAYETVRQAVGSSGCRVIEAMETTGIMNARLKFRLPAALSFEDCSMVPLSRPQKEHDSVCEMHHISPATLPSHLQAAGRGVGPG